MMMRDSSMAQGWLDHEESLAFNRAALMSNAGRYGRGCGRIRDPVREVSGQPQRPSPTWAAALSAAGMADSAQAIYNNLLAGEDLGTRDYFNIGVGLYTAEEFTRAAQGPFQEVVDVSPQNREGPSSTSPYPSMRPTISRPA